MEQKKTSLDMFLIITSIISIAIGIICLAYPNQISELVVILIGVSLITYGIVELFIFFNYKIRSTLILSIIVLLAGTLCFIKPTLILEIIGVFLGLFLVVQGILTIKSTFVLKKAGFNLWWLWFLLSLVIVIIGISGIFNPSSIYGIFAVMLSFGFLINGISNLSLFFFQKRYI